MQTTPTFKSGTIATIIIVALVLLASLQENTNRNRAAAAKAAAPTHWGQICDALPEECR